MPKRKQRKLIIVLSIIFVIVAALVTTFFIYTGNYYHADPSVDTLLSQSTVSIFETDHYYACAPRGAVPDAGYVFYPGGKVDPRAYLPYMADIAAEGYLAIVLKVPFHLAILDMHAAGYALQDYPDIQHWVVGGHSLGGVAAADFAMQSNDAVNGLILLGAYPNGDLSDKTLQVLSITATDDKILNWEKYQQAKPLLPSSTQYFTIQGGNHSQFGLYGHQDGDGTASITAGEQRGQMVEATVGLLRSITPH